MGRDSSGVYTLPAGSSATDGLTAEASQHNLPLTDIEADMNVARPIVAGGTGATDRSSARQNLYMDGNVVSKSANYTARLTDRSKFFRTTATLTLSLKAAATVKDGWYIFVRVETGTTTINPNGSETINGSATIDVAAGETVLVVCDGTAFYSTKLKGLLDISDDASPQLGGVLDTNGHAVWGSKGAALTAAATLTLGSDGDVFHVSGTTPITDFSSRRDGATVEIRTGAGVVFTHGSNLDLPNGANITTAAGDVFMFTQYSSTLWRLSGYVLASGQPLIQTTRQTMHVQDQKASGTDGGAATAGSWETRDLTTAVTNTITGASIASNQITLPAGTFKVHALAPGYKTGEHQARLRDITGSATLLTGSIVFSPTTVKAQTSSIVQGVFTLSTSSAIEIQHQVGNTKATNGHGYAASFGTEVYSDILIEKIA